MDMGKFLTHLWGHLEQVFGVTRRTQQAFFFLARTQETLAGV